MSEDITYNEEDKSIPEESTDNLKDNLSEENTAPDIVPSENSEENTEKSDANINEEKTEEPSGIQNFSGESNYQVSLINENLLRIRVSTVKSVSIDCSVKDIASPGGDASESQSNKIQIHPKADSKPQEVEIIISIDPESGNIVVEKKKIIS